MISVGKKNTNQNTLYYCGTRVFTLVTLTTSVLRPNPTKSKKQCEI